MICDLAETYNVLFYQELPISLVAILVRGLRGNSRVKLALNSQTTSTETILLSGILDRLSLLLWTKTKDAAKGLNRPKLLLDAYGSKDVESYNSGEDFEEARRKFLEGRR